MDTREQLLTCVREFEQSNEPITISKVAAKCGISHSLIYNRHPDIKEMINNLKKKQKENALVEEQKNQTEKLLKSNENLKQKLAVATSNDDKETIRILMAHIHELYSMYDSLLDERNQFAQRILEYSDDK